MFLSQLVERRINRSRIRGPYVRFCERAEVRVITLPPPTRLCSRLYKERGNVFVYFNNILYA